MERYLPNRTVNLTGKAFNDALAQIKMDKPVVVWTTGDYKVPDRWESWKHGNKQITAPLDLHAVVLIGVQPRYVYISVEPQIVFEMSFESFLMKNWR